MNNTLNDAAESSAFALASVFRSAAIASFKAGAQWMCNQPLTDKLNDDDRCKIMEAVGSAYQLLESNEDACNAVIDILRTLFGDSNIVNNPNEICA